MRAKKAIALLFISLFITGCGSKAWYTSYGLAESDLNTDKAIILAGKVLVEGETRRQKKGAADFLKRADLTEKQADILSVQHKAAANPNVHLHITTILMEKGFTQQAFPGLVMGLNNNNANARSRSIRYIGRLGCDAKSTLPMLKVISSNDQRSIQENARIAYRKITVDCMSKGISVDVSQ